ncbi:MAG: hypothetical protein LBU22_09680 [Dysgonamonadaceae bacterium]|jgi:PKD repeat protein|nr:hypothetical protein [Dysgonamonadaceae bacterium]
MKNFGLVFFVLILAFLSACYKEEVVNLKADFDLTVVDNDYTVPVEVFIGNNSLGADRYEWTFEGGIPETSTQKQPENVWYRNAGTYRIELKCWYQERYDSKEITLTLDSAITIAFDAEILKNAFAPVSLQISNRSSGASFYRWTFEGGIPETSEDKYPPLVVYDNPGEYTVRLIAGNESEAKEIVKNIWVLPRMEIDFTATLSFEDEDKEAPAHVFLESLATGALRYKWKAEGGVIENDTARNTSVYFQHPGIFAIMLETDNDKEIKQMEKTIELLPNTNLLSLENVRLGINSAKLDGMFFSGYLKKILKEEEIEDDETLGEQVDWVFFGLNSRFSYCRFLSPDSANLFTFRQIPHAKKTYICNDLKKSTLQFSVADFEAMKNDVPLRSLDIRSNDTGKLFFELSELPRLILFETEDGRKGAVKINKKTENGTDSYIEADIKVQKEKM